MAFWGVVVKPGKPLFYSGSKAQGKLKITNATLCASGSSTEKTYLQFKVMETKTTIFLCALLPNKTETCSLDLAFGERDYVMFSVIGPPAASVHLTGYHVCDGDTSIREPLGYEKEYVDGENENEHSNQGSENDKYDSSFINDSGASVVAASSRRGKKKSKKKNQNQPAKKEKNQIKKSEDDDEDGYMLSVWKDVEED